MRVIHVSRRTLLSGVACFAVAGIVPTTVAHAAPAAGDRYGLFYFFAQSCAACEAFDPILRMVSDRYRMPVMAVSMDGGPNRMFPGYVVDSGQRARMGVAGRATPVLVLFDTQTRRILPIGSGLMSADEVMQRISLLTTPQTGSDRR